MKSVESVKKLNCNFCGSPLKIHYEIKQIFSYLSLYKLKCTGCGIETSERLIK